jgi:hypothetical protein
VGNLLKYRNAHLRHSQASQNFPAGNHGESWESSENHTILDSLYSQDSSGNDSSLNKITGRTNY